MNGIVHNSLGFFETQQELAMATLADHDSRRDKLKAKTK